MAGIYSWLIACIPTVVLVFYVLDLIKRTVHNLQGKHILVTGGSSGIGKCVAIEAVKLGADVTIVARDSNKLEMAAREIRNHCITRNQRVQTLSLNVSEDYEKVEKALNVIQGEKNKGGLGSVFMLFNCAGTAICGIFEDLTMDEMHHLINLNLFGNLHTIKAILPTMKDRKEGHIVITASVAAIMGIYGLSVYSCSKFALRGLAESLRMELLPFNIKVTLALPPDTDTPGFENENKTKPKITHLISESAGLYKPEVVAKKIMQDALNGKFFSVVGLESHLLVALCSGFSPVRSFFELIFQSVVMGLFRLASYFLNIHFDKIIAKNLAEADTVAVHPPPPAHSSAEHENNGRD